MGLDDTDRLAWVAEQDADEIATLLANTPKGLAALRAAIDERMGSIEVAERSPGTYVFSRGGKVLWVSEANNGRPYLTEAK